MTRLEGLYRVGISFLLAWLGLAALGGGRAGLTGELQPHDLAIQRHLAGLAPHYPNCRFGVGGDTAAFSTTALNVGWSMDWSTQLNPPRPNGAEYVQVVRLKPATGGYVFTPPTATLLAILDQNPGATWLIGNEPDSPAQDNLWPETYARAYHQLYYLIKERDPGAQVAAGNIVQPTPLRMQYLDRVLSTYRQNYGEDLPADLWSIHSYILREIDPSDPEAMPYGPYEVWGAFIPPGITATRGMLYTYSQMYDVMIFRQRLLDFRLWLRDRGYRETPLYITEYGTLFPYVPYITPPNYVDENDVEMNETRAAGFLTGTFNVLRQLTESTSGLPADAHRVVQRWLWYSVSDTNYGGPLFDPGSGLRRPLGDAFAAYTAAITPEVDLLAVQVLVDPPVIAYAGEPVTVTLHGRVSNLGNISVTPPVTVSFYAGTPTSATLLGTRVITSPLAGCGASVLASVTWPGLTAGAHLAFIEVAAAAPIVETTYSNNLAAGVALIATHQIYLPKILRK